MGRVVEIISFLFVRQWINSFPLQFAHNLRNAGLFMYTTNLEHHGHLKEMDSYNTEHKVWHKSLDDDYQGVY